MFSSVAQVEEGWWEGVLNGKTGMFPSNFIKELSDSDDTRIVHEEHLIKPSKRINIHFILALAGFFHYTMDFLFLLSNEQNLTDL